MLDGPEMLTLIDLQKLFTQRQYVALRQTLKHSPDLIKNHATSLAQIAQKSIDRAIFFLSMGGAFEAILQNAHTSKLLSIIDLYKNPQYQPWIKALANDDYSMFKSTTGSIPQQFPLSMPMHSCPLYLKDLATALKAQACLSLISPDYPQLGASLNEMLLHLMIVQPSSTLRPHRLPPLPANRSLTPHYQRKHPAPNLALYENAFLTLISSAQQSMTPFFQKGSDSIFKRFIKICDNYCYLGDHQKLSARGTKELSTQENYNAYINNETIAPCSAPFLARRCVLFAKGEKLPRASYFPSGHPSSEFTNPLLTQLVCACLARVVDRPSPLRESLIKILAKMEVGILQGRETANNKRAPTQKIIKALTLWLRRHVPIQHIVLSDPSQFSTFFYQYGQTWLHSLPSADQTLFAAMSLFINKNADTFKASLCEDFINAIAPTASYGKINRQTLMRLLTQHLENPPLFFKPFLSFFHLCYKEHVGSDHALAERLEIALRYPEAHSASEVVSNYRDHLTTKVRTECYRSDQLNSLLETKHFQKNLPLKILKLIIQAGLLVDYKPAYLSIIERPPNDRRLPALTR